MKTARLSLIVLATTALSATPSTPEHFAITLEANVAMTTRDGVTLRADIYRPKVDGKFPVLLQRAPYDKRIYVSEAILAAQRGYVYIVQDSRGRFASDGEWYPFRDEARDTYDAVEWAAALPYSNGQVAMTGISYVAVPQLLGAMTAPPHLVAIYPGITASNYHSHWTYHGGALTQSFSQGWAQYFTQGEVMRRATKSYAPAPPPAPGTPAAEYPLVESFSATHLAPWYQDWIAHPAYDDYWRQWSVEESYGKIKVPALHWGAWYDFFMPGAIRNYTGLKAHGGSEAARKGQRLVISTGGHAGVGRRIGAIDFGQESDFDFIAYGLRWFDWVLKGIDDGIAEEKPVRLFIMGTNVWRNEEDWPLARAQPTRYYLHSGGKANALLGDGVLSTNAPAAEPPDQYIYDPANPTPTYGGYIASPAGIGAGPQDQRAIESRDDILVYTTPAFAHDTEITGPIILELHVSSSAVDTDFTGKLVDVWPNGFAQNLCEGILRVRYRHSMEKPELMNPGQVYPLTIDLGATANVFLAGHRLRLEVASANFPRFSRNPNTGEQPETARSGIKATNTVYHSHIHPSALVLPLIPTEK